MAINDISLTQGMRNNLVQLQQTVSLLDRTQERLSTGKKVNTALDNPVNYFAAKSHMSRASDIASFKDNMSEGVQTIQAANAGITAITGLIEAARSLGQSAVAADANSVGFSVGSISVGNAITVNGQAYTAVATNTSTANTFAVQDDDGDALSSEQIASNLAAEINSDDENTKAIVSSGTRITVHDTRKDNAITATSQVAGASGFTVDDEITKPREDLAAQYEGLLTQIDTLGTTSGYKGTNLLDKDTLSVNFEGGTLSVQGFNANVSDLGVNTTGAATDDTIANHAWAAAADIKTDIINLDKGLLKLKSEASKLSSSLSVISIQQEFSTSKINLLTAGADALTAADTNEEGANMLMLQTRQSLGTTALSLSSQAAQSVLRLFA
jgi:flagellin